MALYSKTLKSMWFHGRMCDHSIGDFLVDLQKNSVVINILKCMASGHKRKYLQSTLRNKNVYFTGVHDQGRSKYLAKYSETTFFLKLLILKKTMHLKLFRC